VPLRPLRMLLLLALALPGAACVTSQSTKYFASPKRDAVHTEPARAWRLLHGEESAGFVVLFRAAKKDGQLWFAVRNEWNQELGMVDSLGRAWRFRPHGEEAEWLGSGTVADGAALILRLEGVHRLTEIGLETLPQSST